MIRLQKAMSQAGLMSRRAAEELIREGRVTVDGRVAVLGDRVDPTVGRVEIDGIPMPVAPDLVTYLINKPLGVISTSDDPQGRETVLQLVPADVRVWPVGRLDADSEGLLLLSNDGELTHRVTHPSFGVTKKYVALVEGLPSQSEVARLVAGLELDDGPAAAHRARVVDSSRGRTLIEVEMGEGRNREVRRMFDVLGYPVSRLVRVAIGPLMDRSLAPGAWRQLAVAEVRSLYEAAGRQD
ncbi:MAG: rRNA pseudouridine synthase [Acidimicrobiia bacterium]|nr:rRNA pseudouridine synthase [Acidimicrobiia bacterium]